MLEQCKVYKFCSLGVECSKLELLHSQCIKFQFAFNSIQQVASRRKTCSKGEMVLFTFLPYICATYLTQYPVNSRL